MPPGMYSTMHFLEILRLSAFKSPLFYPSSQGWPLLTVETEVNGDSKSKNEGCPCLVGSSGLSCRCKRFLISLGCSSRPSTKYIFFFTVHYFNSFCPHRPASWAGSRAGSPVSQFVSPVGTSEKVGGFVRRTIKGIVLGQYSLGHSI